MNSTNNSNTPNIRRMSKNENFEERLKKLCINAIEDNKTNLAQVKFEIKKNSKINQFKL